MSPARTYSDTCGIARALDLVGDRWALLVVRELIFGPKRFSDVSRSLTKLGPDVLTQRLKDLEEAGIVERRTLPPPSGARVYELTDWGRELDAVLLALGRWGNQAPFPPGHEPLGPDAFMLALRTVFDPARPAGVDANYEVRLNDDIFRVFVRDGALTVERGEAADPDAVIESTPAVLTQVLWHGRSLTSALEAGEIRGDRAAVERFLALFPPPRPVS